jgi:hypothetical protein
VRRPPPVLRGLPMLIVMIAAAVAGMAWAISSPIGSSPDEDYHLASIWCPPPAEASGCHLTPGRFPLITQLKRVVGAPACYASNSSQSGACIWAIPADALIENARFDQGGYPGGFYHVLHIFASNDPYSAIYLIRGFNVAIAVVLGALVVLGANRPTRRILAYAVASTYVPMGMFIIPAANPSSWAVMGLTATAFALHSYWIAETRGRVIFNGALAAVGIALAASSRADAALYTVLAAVGVTCLHYRSVRRHPVRLILPAGVLVAGFIAYRTSAQATSALSGTGLGSVGAIGGWRLLFSNIINSPYLVLGNEGLNSLGWLDTPMPPMVFVPMLVVCGFLVMAGIGRLTWMKALVTFGGMFAVVGIPLYILQISHLTIGAGLQPRYLLPLLPVVSLVLLTGYRPSQAVRLSRPAAWVAWVLVSVANSVALMVNIRRYTTGLDGPMWPGQAVEWWSTDRMGPLPTWILGSLGFAVAAWMIVRLSSGHDTPTAVAMSDEKAIEPAPHSNDDLSLAPVPAVVDDQPVPVEPVPVEPVPVEPVSAQAVAPASATPEYRMSTPASQSPPGS